MKRLRHKKTGVLYRWNEVSARFDCMEEVDVALPNLPVTGAQEADLAGVDDTGNIEVALGKIASEADNLVIDEPEPKDELPD